MQENETAAKAPVQEVVCIDLDNTLVATDTLWECAAACLRVQPLLLLVLPFWFLKGRAAMKSEFAKRIPCDVDTLPVNEDVLAYAKQAKSRGAKVVLATAATSDIAERVANRFQVFDEVIASDGATNMKGRVKAAELARRFGTQGFTYVGDSRSDLHVWTEAREAITVGAGQGLNEKVRNTSRLSHTLPAPSARLRDYVRLARVYQWVKNVLVFAPALASGLIADAQTLFVSCLAFLSMSLIASGLYIVNDLTDLPADRVHPGKRNRPIASGVVGIPQAIAFSVFLLAVGAGISVWVGITGIVAVYAAASLLYSVMLKRLPIFDTFALAGLYVIRIVVGGMATGIGVSIWLMAFSGFMFLSLAMLKRVAEFHRTRDLQKGVRGYLPSDETLLMVCGIASSFASAVVLSLFVTTLCYIWPFKSIISKFHLVSFHSKHTRIFSPKDCFF